MYNELKQARQELTAAGAQFELEDIEVRGNSIRWFKTAPTDLRMIWMASQAHGDQDYLVYNNERWTYKEAHAQVASVANWLQSQGVGAGDRVALAMRNYPEWILSCWAVIATGAAVVGINSWWAGPELVYALNDSSPKVFICDQERFELFVRNKDECPEMKVVPVRMRGTPPYDWTIDWIDLISEGGNLPQVQIEADSDALIFYTSGTTGMPKGAQLTHRGCVANIMNILFSGMSLMRMQELQGLPVPALEDMPPGASLITTPLFHVTALNCVVHPGTLQGNKLVLMYRWDPERALELIEEEKITAMTGVPVMSRELIAHENFSKTDTSSLLALGGGGAALQPDLVHKIERQVATARPGTGYGMTEVCGIITTISGDIFIDKPESCGQLVPTLAGKVVDDAGKEVPVGETGELWVKGSPVIRGYLNKPEATAESITEGWLHTGDLARMDEQNFCYIVDRKKDMVLRGGENIYCAEVENAIFSHKEVVECAVFGVSDERLGEEVGAAIVLAENAAVSTDDIREHCRELIAHFKVPRYIWLQEELLPRNANGKFVKRQLRETLKPEDAT